jgi:hypothetical protein
MGRMVTCVLGAAAFLGCSGPTGPAGPPGEQGATGSQGQTGSMGSMGSMGAMGTAGEAGAPGMTGATGPAGPIGEAGAPGAKGPGVVWKDATGVVVPAIGHVWNPATVDYVDPAGYVWRVIAFSPNFQLFNGAPPNMTALYDGANCTGTAYVDAYGYGFAPRQVFTTGADQLYHSIADNPNASFVSPTIQSSRDSLGGACSVAGPLGRPVLPVSATLPQTPIALPVNPFTLPLHPEYSP